MLKWFRSLRNYFRDAWGELRKVSWPGRKELLASTITVLVVIVIMGVFLGVADLVLTSLMSFYLK